MYVCIYLFIYLSIYLSIIYLASYTYRWGYSKVVGCVESPSNSNLLKVPGVQGSGVRVNPILIVFTTLIWVGWS